MIIESVTIYKLMILYMLNKLDSQLTNAQVLEFFVQKEYTDYFNIQQTLSELCDSGFVEVSKVHNTSYYSLTPEGYDTLTYFKSQIPKGALEDVNKYLEDNKFALKNEVGTQAGYYRHTSGDYIAHCQIMEGKALLYELNIAVPSEEEAKHIVSNWRTCSEDIYAYVMKTLLS